MRTPRTLQALVLVGILAAGGCRLVGEFVMSAIEVSIDAALHEDDDHGPPPPPPPRRHRSPRVLDRTRLR